MRVSICALCVEHDLKHLLAPGRGFVELSFVSRYASLSDLPRQVMIGSILNAGWCASASGRM